MVGTKKRTACRHHRMNRPIQQSACPNSSKHADKSETGPPCCVPLGLPSGTFQNRESTSRRLDEIKVTKFYRRVWRTNHLRPSPTSPNTLRSYRVALGEPNFPPRTSPSPRPRIPAPWTSSGLSLSNYYHQRYVLNSVPFHAEPLQLTAEERTELQQMTQSRTWKGTLFKTYL